MGNTVEDEVLEALKIIAQDSTNMIINQESVENLITFVKQNKGKIIAEIDDKKYILKYSSRNEDNEKSNLSTKLKSFFLTRENDKSENACLTMADAIILNYVIEDAINRRKYQKKKKVNPSKKAGLMLKLIIEAKLKCKECNYDIGLEIQEIEEEIKHLEEEEETLRNNPSKLTKREDSKEDESYTGSEKSDRLNKIHNLIVKNNFLIQILTGEHCRQIRQTIFKQLYPGVLEDLINEYEKTGNVCSENER